MLWSIESITNLIKELNKKYFHNSIKAKIRVEWSRRYYTSNGAEATLTTKATGIHILKLNTALYNATPELMKNTLVHELIHAWQSEHQEDLGDEWHDETFHKWCEKLNKTGDFKYPISSTATLKEQKDFDKSNNCAYFVYRITNSKKIYGVFINFLYDEEINWLKNKGFYLKYFKQIKPKNKALNIDELNVYFANISDMTKSQITPTNIKTKIGKSKIFTNKDFNFKDRNGPVIHIKQTKGKHND